MDMKVLPDLLANLVARYQKPALLRYKEGGAYHDISTAQVEAYVRTACVGLRDAGLDRGDRVALLSENRPEWCLADLAIQSLGAVNVPIYPTLLAEQIRYILADCGARAIFCSTADQLAKIRAVRGQLPALEKVIVLDPPEGSADGITPWTDLCERGRRAAEARPGLFDQLRSAVQPEDLASIIYTSGTTGLPKGVMLTHDNFMSNIRATVSVMPISEDDTTLSFLPLSHVFERMVEYAYLFEGATIAYAESVDTVPQNLQEVRPTIAGAVPRVFEKFYARVMEAVNAGSGLKKQLFFWALGVGRKRLPYLLEDRPLPAGLALQVSLAQKLVFHKLQQRVGGRLSYFLSGGAPLNPDLAAFFWSVGIRIFEGYGLSETSPVIAVNRPGAVRLGTVGPLIPDVEVRIAKDGEILVKGPNVMKGYYQNEEANRQAFRDGWFCTGDIGNLDEEGFLSITDRKKDVIKTSGGKMVAPQPMENALKTNKYIANAVVLGERRKFIAALLVPNFDNLEAFCRKAGLADLPLEERLEHPEVMDLFRRQVDRVLADRPRYEQIKAFRLLPRDFALEEGEITPTMKVKRNVIEKNYQDQIRGLYPDEDAPGARG